MKRLLTLSFLRIIALIILLSGAVASLIFMFNAGRNQRSILLIVLFTAWVLSPYMTLFIADMIFKRWLTLTRKALYFLSIFVTFGSVISYSGALDSPNTKTAFKFLVVPLISWLLILILLIVASRSRKLSINRSDTNQSSV